MEKKVAIVYHKNAIIAGLAVFAMKRISYMSSLRTKQENIPVLLLFAAHVN